MARVIIAGSPLMSSARTGTGRDDWCTPRAVLDRIVACIGPIAIDPCANPESVVPAARSIMLPEDGLTAEWGRGLAFVNPPYSKARAWLERCATRSTDGATIALVPARTCTKAWHRSASTASAVCLVEGRLRFGGAITGAPFPSAFLFWSPWPATRSTERLTSRFVDFGAVLGCVYRGAPFRRRAKELE